MATVAEIQAVLDARGTGSCTHIQASTHLDDTLDAHYCVGYSDAPGLSKWCTVVAAETAEQNAADILAALRAG